MIVEDIEYDITAATSGTGTVIGSAGDGDFSAAGCPIAPAYQLLFYSHLGFGNIGTPGRADPVPQWAALVELCTVSMVGSQQGELRLREPFHQCQPDRCRCGNANNLFATAIAAVGPHHDHLRSRHRASGEMGGVHGGRWWHGMVGLDLR
jgi:hypothetical protein